MMGMYHSMTNSVESIWVLINLKREVLFNMENLTLHTAGEIVDNRQKCSNCGQMLVNYSGSTAIGKSQFTFFAPGTIVTLTPSGVLPKAITGAKACTT